MVTLPLTIEYALLGFLRERPMYGYEIHQALSAPTGLGLVWGIKQSRLYALLAKLEQNNYVTTTLEPQENRPARKVFELTDRGRTVFLAWIQSPVERGRQFRLDFLAKLYFSQYAGSTAASALIEQQRAACRQWLAEEQTMADAQKNGEPFDWLVHQFRLNQTQAMLNWLDICQQTLTARSAWRRVDSA